MHVQPSQLATDAVNLQEIVEPVAVYVCGAEGAELRADLNACRAALQAVRGRRNLTLVGPPVPIAVKAVTGSDLNSVVDSATITIRALKGQIATVETAQQEDGHPAHTKHLPIPTDKVFSSRA
jgi:hypothetical protein